jgi:hypothetical protein
MSQQISWNFRVIQEFPVYRADFQQFSTLESNLATKFVKLCDEIFIIKRATHHVSKKVSFIKIHPRRPKIPSVECRKTCGIHKSPSREKKLLILFDFTRFLTQNGRYLLSPLMEFDEWYLFGNVMSCTFYDENFSTKFHEFHCQMWLQSWNLLKIGRVYREFSNNSEVARYLLGHILLFRKVSMQAFQQTLKI